MPPHSRKRGRRERGGGGVGGGAGGAGGAGVAGGGGGAGVAGGGGGAGGGPRADAGPAAPSRAEERNAAVRATLAPLAPGERPLALKIAIVLAAAIGIGNIVQAAVGTHVKVGGTRSSVGGSLLFSAVMLVCAAGMWRLRYWAALGFQALLGIVIIAFVFVALTANDVLRLAIALAVVVAGGALFWKMVRVLGRLQMPTPPGRR